MSYDVSAVFTSIPIESAINIIEKHLKGSYRSTQ